MNKIGIGLAIVSVMWSIFLIKLSVSNMREIREIQRKIKDREKEFKTKFNK